MSAVERRDAACSACFSCRSCCVFRRCTLRSLRARDACLPCPGAGERETVVAAARRRWNRRRIAICVSIEQAATRLETKREYDKEATRRVVCAYSRGSAGKLQAPDSKLQPLGAADGCGSRRKWAGAAGPTSWHIPADQSRERTPRFFGAARMHPQRPGRRRMISKRLAVSSSARSLAQPAPGPVCRGPESAFGRRQRRRWQHRNGVTERTRRKRPGARMLPEMRPRKEARPRNSIARPGPSQHEVLTP